MMGPDTQITISFIISIVSIICVLINTTGGEKKRQNELVEREKNRQLDIEKNFVKVNVKLDDFCETSKRLMMESSEKSDQLKRISEQLIVLTQQTKTLFKYHDDHEERLKAIESKVK